MVFKKHRDYGSKSVIRNFVIWSSCAKISLPTLFKAYIHPSLWFIAEGPRVSTPGVPPFDHALRSDEWTAQLHKHHILGYVGVYVDDLLIAGPRSLNDSMIQAVQHVWKMSAPEHLGPDADCVPVLTISRSES